MRYYIPARAALCAGLAVAALAGCRERPADPSAPTRLVAMFSGEVDGVTGTLRIWPDGPSTPSGVARTALVEIPVVSDGRPGSGPPDTVEFATEATRIVAGTGPCAGTDVFEGDVRVRSFHAAATLRNVYVEILRITPTGREACASAAAVPGVSAANGLFAYGDLAPAGAAGDSAVATWNFRLPDRTSFTFQGRVMADVATDWTAPSVVSVTPGAGAVGVAATATVSVTFSEPVDPATVTAASFSVSGPGGPVTGVISVDPGQRVYTFAPAAVLQPEAQYLVSVTTGVRDLAGNALAAACASSFYTVTSRKAVHPTTYATLRNHQLAFDYYGNALAAWSAVTQAGSAVVFSTYSAASGTWSAARVLDAERDPRWWNANPVRVATDGTRFLVAWCTRSAVKAMQVQSGFAGAVSTLATGGASLVQTELAASSPAANRFLVARSYLSTVRGWYWNGTSWSAETSIGTGSYARASPALSGRTIYYLGGDNVSVMASTYGTAWGAPVAVATTTLGQGSPVSLSVASGSTTLLVYGTSVGHVWAKSGSGTTFGSAWDVSGSGSEVTAPLAVAAGVWGNELAVAWVTASGRAYGSFHDNGGWPPITTPTQLFSEGGVDVSLGGYSYGFVAAVALRDAGSSTASLWAIPSGGSPGARTWSSSSAVGVESSSATVAEPGILAVGTSAMVHWTQADAAAHQVMLRPYDGASLGTAQTASAPAAVRGSPADVHAAANARGDVLAVWTQDDLGSPNVFAAIHGTNGWGAPVKVLSRAYWPQVASNGSGFLVIATAESETEANARSLVAVPYENGAFGATETVAPGGSSYARVGSDGTDYAVTWARTSAEAAIRAGGVWLPTQSFGPGISGAVAGRPGEYLFLWTESSRGYLYQVRATGSGSSWTWEPMRLAGYDGSSYADAVAGPDGFFVAYSTTGGLVNGWKVVGGAPVAGLSLGGGLRPCDPPRVAESGGRYLVGVNCSDALSTAETDGTSAPARTTHAYAWQTLVPSPTALGYSVAGGSPGRFRIGYSFSSGPSAPANMYWKESASGLWGGTSLLDNLPESTQSGTALAWDGGAWLAFWNQTAASNPAIVDELFSLWAF